MNEKILKETFISGIRSGNLDLELNDTIVDDLLEHPVWQVTQSSKERAKARLQSKRQDAAIAVAKEMIPNGQLLSFGRFLEAVREKARLSRMQIAGRLGRDESYVLRVERGDVIPVSVPPSECADIMGLFQIGFGSVSQMIAVSVKTSDSKRTYRAAARSHGGLRRDVRSEDVERALDAFARKMHTRAANTDAGSEVQTYLTKLEEELKKRGREDLLK